MRRIALICVLLLALPAFGQGFFIYPERGQGPEQQQQDEFECQSWAQRQSGFNPLDAPAQGRSTGGSAVRGGLGGAAIGAAVSGVTGRSASRGAKGGAVAGGMIGGMSAHGANRQQQQAEQAGRNNFNRAYVACLEGRGYSIR